jgi:predicted nucleic acid-binding protein
LTRRQLCVTSSTTAVEMTRAAARARARQHGVLGPHDVDDLLSTTVEMVLTDRVRWTAASLEPTALRTLDAIHVASALALGPDLAAVITYDIGMQQAAQRCRLRVLAPATS